MPTIIINNNEVQYTHDTFSAEIIESNGKKKLLPRSKNGIACRTFSNPVTCNNLSKIYVIKNRFGSIVYVGKTTQSISTRLRAGLNPVHETGYHGYQWQEKEIISIHCITVQSFSDNEIEATEAEIVFLFRRNREKWPEYQTEIHFSNNPRAKIMSEAIYNEIDTILA